ncbi:hypothetical protein [Stenotrophomonas sp. CC120223-11]|uniref:hypothetical protein n=1 Tax=Stenotrophomonas sp. CC120223-11 TaxID=1378090 RepID=UPI000BCB5403|nr:hypothetical protein [Stenotrophomonas sp. CC120223-11]SNY65244.1 hypothetical protein SAMN02744784_01548 [Stenotrophomonas sp. CC120223-11]
MLSSETNQERRIRTSIDRSRYSAITWRAETRSILLQEIEDFTWPRMFRRVEIPRNDEALQIDLHSDRFFRPITADEKITIEREHSAKLVVGIHPNGTISFYASGFSSSHASVDGDGFTIAFFQCAQDLAGVAGRRSIRQALSSFCKLASISLTEVAPTKAGGRFISLLSRRSSRFRFLYTSSDEARRVRVSQYLGFAGGLAGGLISSSIFPLLVSVGQSLKEQKKDVPIFFQPECVLLFSLILAVAALYVIVKAMSQR